jgi:hypothetical protein
MCANEWVLNTSEWLTNHGLVPDQLMVDSVQQLPG